jgi:NADH-quinone oxidoreductase subunit H
MPIGSGVMLQAALQGWLALGGIQAAAALAAYAILVVLLVVAFDYAFGWAERKTLAAIQSRRGPTRAGGYGLLQNFADITKLLSKEDATPRAAGSFAFKASLLLMPAAFVFLVMLLPLSPGSIGGGLSLGLLAVFVVLCFVPSLVFVCGFSSGNKFAEISAQRTVVSQLGYGMPMVIVAATVAMLAGTYGLQGIVAAQAGAWYALLMPLGFAVFFVALLASLGKAPLDAGETDSELAAGWLTDVSAPYYALALFADYARMFLGGLLVSILFLGGWLGPVLPPVVWLLIKAFVVLLCITVVRAALASMRIDRILRFGWVALVPLAALNLIIVLMLFIR